MLCEHVSLTICFLPHSPPCSLLSRTWMLLRMMSQWMVHGIGSEGRHPVRHRVDCLGKRNTSLRTVIFVQPCSAGLPLTARHKSRFAELPFKTNDADRRRHPVRCKPRAAGDFALQDVSGKACRSVCIQRTSMDLDSDFSMSYEGTSKSTDERCDGTSTTYAVPSLGGPLHGTDRQRRAHCSQMKNDWVALGQEQCRWMNGWLDGRDGWTDDRLT